MKNNDYFKEFVYWLLHDAVSVNQINSAIEKSIESRILETTVFNPHIMNYAEEISKILRNDQ